MELELTTYLTDREPPEVLVSSGRCIILAERTVLVMTNPGGKHILPGGRRKPGETIWDATVREITEETGLVVEPLRQLAVQIFRHLTPRPSIYPYPYPVFIHTVYVGHLPVARELDVVDSYELAGHFVDVSSAGKDIPAHELVLLEAALE